MASEPSVVRRSRCQYYDLKSLGIPDVVKTKEYVDMEALESAIYHNQVDAKALAPFKEDHYINTLRVTKPKRLVEDI